MQRINAAHSAHESPGKVICKKSKNLVIPGDTRFCVYSLNISGGDRIRTCDLEVMSQLFPTAKNLKFLGVFAHYSRQNAFCKRYYSMAFFPVFSRYFENRPVGNPVVYRPRACACARHLLRAAVTTHTAGDGL